MRKPRTLTKVDSDYARRMELLITSNLDFNSGDGYQFSKKDGNVVINGYTIYDEANEVRVTNVNGELVLTIDKTNPNLKTAVTKHTV